MTAVTPLWIFIAGMLQLGVLLASALVPVHLRWKETLSSLPVLVRQLFWVYAAYVVSAILALGIVCLTCSRELAGGTPLARAVCIFGACFWGVRLLLQAWLNVKPHLTNGWLRCGYHALTVDFMLITTIYLWGALS